MKSNNTLILFVLLLGITASAEEARAQRTGLFLFQNVQQWVDVNYDYDGQSISGGKTSLSSINNHSEEKYHFSVDYSIYDKRILEGIFAGDFDLNQQLSNANGTSSDGSNVGYDYSFSGEFLNHSLFPIHFSRLHQRNYIQQAFSPSYTLLTESNFVDFAVKNNFLPFKFTYSGSNNSTSGLSEDRSQDTNVFTLTAQHNLRNVSKTDFTLSSYIDHTMLKSGIGGTQNRKYELNLRNVTLLGTQNSGRSLDSTLLISHSSTVFTDKSMNLSEVLSFPLGKALSTGGDYSFSSRDTQIGTGVPNTQRSNLEHAWLQHQLFESLTTRLDLTARQDSLSTGNESDTTGGVSLSYVKRLPWQGSLQVTLGEQYQVTDRDLVSPTIVVPNELYTVQGLAGSSTVPDDVVLKRTNVDPDTPVIVVNADNSRIPNRYVEGTDFTVVREGSTTKLKIISDNIHVGDRLLVTYSYLVNPKIKYSTTTTHLTGATTFRDGRYRLFGSWTDSHQGLISGSTEAMRLVDGKTMLLGFETNLERTRYGASAEMADSSLDKHQTYVGFYSYKKFIARGLGTVTLTDRYMVTESIASLGSTGSDINASSISLNYTRAFWNSGVANFTTNYTKSLGSATNRDDITLMTNLRWAYGRLNVSLLAQQDWRIFSGQVTRNDQVRLVLMRYF